MKKIALWIVKNVIWPILKEVIAEVLVRFIALLAEYFKSLLEKWRKAEEQSAKTQAERDAVNQRYRERSADVDELAQRMSKRVATIVEQALKDAEANRDRLLETPPPVRRLPHKKGPARA